MVIILFLLNFISWIYGLDARPEPVQGRFTKNIRTYELMVPHRITKSGEFLTFALTNFFKHDYENKRRKRSFDDPNAVHYNLRFADHDHHLVLWPNHGFLSPEMVVEHQYPGAEYSVEARRLKRKSPVQCHYTGMVRGELESSVAVSLCDGIVGHVKTEGQHFFIEPVDGHGPNEQGHHLHVVHPSESSEPEINPNCATENWENGWQRALRPANQTRQTRPEADRHRFVEVLVVADKKFIDYHKDRDYETYILTVMNMVSELFHDASTGSSIDIVVVRIMYLNRNITEFDLTITQDSATTLKSFCQWQERVNPKDLTSPHHHDIAILITRADVCAKSTADCGVLGAAYVATACDPSRACSINEDKGLLLGVVVAHELGHILGCGHDSSHGSGCSPKSGKHSYHVMAPTVKMATSSWSTCSRKFMDELFNNQLGECLLDEPQATHFKGLEMMPGAIYDADYQCQMIYPNSSHCLVDEGTFCETLFCKHSAKSCLTNNQPPAAGTKCGHEKWCYHQQCIAMGQRPKSVAGGWSGWGKYGPCTRSCGGGVQHADRECNNPSPQNGGLSCVGESRKYQLCNVNPCPKNTLGYRAQQCKHWGRSSVWKPFFPANENACVLFCINEKNVYQKMAPQCSDGTPCQLGTNNVCLAGECRIVGCDWKLGSSARPDQCGVCNGNGKMCTKTTGNLITSKKAVKIPAGAKNIVIKELSPSENMIVVTSSDSRKSYLNAKAEEIDGEKDFCGSVGYYMHPIENQGKLIIPGPLNCSLSVRVSFDKTTQVGFMYEYVFPRNLNFFQRLFPRKRSLLDFVLKNSDRSVHWEFFEWSPCNKRCDGGESVSEPICVSRKGEVSDKLCEQIPKPKVKTRICNKTPCKTSWKPSVWGKCSGCKHAAGSQSRTVQCVTENPHWEEDDTIEDCEKCVSQDGPKPPTTQLCVGKCSRLCPKSDRFAREIQPKLSDHNFQVLFKRIDTILIQPMVSKENKSGVKQKTGHDDTDVDQTNKKRQPAGEILLLGAPKIFHIRSERDLRSPSTIVTDEISRGRNVLISVPFNNQPNISSLSDEAFEKLGDGIGGTIDILHQCQKRPFQKPSKP